MRSRLSRAMLVLHRYLGVLVGVLMTVWCLSGFVMMYQDYPSVSEEERIAGLQPLDLAGPLALEALPFASEEDIGRFSVEMLDGRPVLRTGGRGGPVAYDLRSGAKVAELSPEQVAGTARLFAEGNGIPLAGDPQPRLMDEMDQWTIQPFRSAQPLYHVVLGDAASSEIYVSAASGTVVQDTDRVERVLSWLGAIPHWLYPTVLRRNGPLWTEIVIWSSLIGTFLTVTGLYVGIGRIALKRKGRLSPYKGLWYWHHMLGLVFGIVTMTWVFSGLLTMNPWGVLAGRTGDLRQEISGSADWADVRTLLENASRSGLPEGTTRLDPAMLGGRLFALAHAPGSAPVRLDVAARPAPVEAAEARAAIAGLPVADFEYLTGEDAYHYSYKDRAAEPVYRAIVDDEQETRIYIDAATGEVTRIVDDAARENRWLRIGLHRLDFVGGRPVWDAVVLLLLAGVTAVCATGAWMSMRRVSRDFRTFRRRRKRRRGRAAGHDLQQQVRLDRAQLQPALRFLNRLVSRIVRGAER